MRHRTLPTLTFALAATILANERVALANGCPTSAEDSYQWWYSEGGYDTKMSSISDYYCWVETMAGDWSGTGSGGSEQGVLLQVENDGYWHLKTYESTDLGYAACQPASCFQGEYSGYSVEWNNINYPNDFWAPAVSSDTCGDGCDPETQSGVGFPGLAGSEKAITMLAGWPLGQGATNGSGEYTSVDNNGGPDNVSAQSCVENEDCWGILTASFNAIFVGSLNTSTDVWPAIYGNTYGTYQVDLGATLDDGICYLSGVSGQWRNSEVDVYVSWNGSAYEWYADTRNFDGSIAANYQCMAYVIDH